MTYRDTLVALSGATGDAVAALWARLEAGEITAAAFVELTAVKVSVANRSAVALADLGLAATLTAQLRRPVPVLGLETVDDLDRLRTAASTVVDLGTPGRAARLGRAEPLETAARAYSEGIARSPHVNAWRRQTSGTACPLCTEWAAAGVLPDTVQMATHKGCSCVPVPITRGG